MQLVVTVLLVRIEAQGGFERVELERAIIAANTWRGSHVSGVSPHRQLPDLVQQPPPLCEDLLHEVILCVGYFTVLHPDNQVLLQSGQPPTVLQQLCSLPFQYFSDPRLTHVLFPTLVACCYNNQSNRLILEQELSGALLSNFIEERLLEQQQSKVMPSTVKKTKGQGESAPDSFLVYLGVCVCVGEKTGVKRDVCNKDKSADDIKEEKRMAVASLGTKKREMRRPACLYHAASLKSTGGLRSSTSKSPCEVCRADDVPRRIPLGRALNARLLLEESDEDVVDQPQSTY
ncbi:hypothetical protein C0Q70_19841 [Pomacea canaliculata]|uniref:S phase cyclin A-associated protein in the endoplasmic reticulum N-terminal domain-containing protein n=1 Tax=Pomacea canaliculata TaxID=400727 RepID=A0A2T7NDV5_POMCA|nr:hypothetical protein C0Q70_19841 [Pomacea canaliculata]